MNIKENIKKIIIKKPLTLDCGKTIENYPLAYETYGKLNEKKDNAILTFHALSGENGPLICGSRSDKFISIILS